MANRYWVGGTGDWADTAHWSATDGGSGGEAVPTMYEDVFITSSSGFGSGGDISFDSDTDINCGNFTANSGHTYTITLYSSNTDTDMNCYGDITLEAGLSFVNQFYDFGINWDCTLTSNGVSIPVEDSMYVIGARTLQLADDLSQTGDGYFAMTDAGQTFTTNNHDCYFVNGTDFARNTVNLGSSVVTIDNAGSFGLGASVTLNAGTSTIRYLSYSVQQIPVGKVFYDLWFDIGASATGGWIAAPGGGTTTLHSIKDTGTVAHELTFGATETYVLTGTLDVSGTVGNVISIVSSFPTHTFTLSKTSGTVVCDYVSIKDSVAAGGAIWFARNSTNVSGNTGWIFEAPIPNSPLPSLYNT